MEEEEEEDQREMARTKGTKRMEPSAETDKSHLKRNTRKHFDGQTDRRLSYRYGISESYASFALVKR